MSLRGVLHVGQGDLLGFWCPGCEEIHFVSAGGWSFNGDFENPTFHPSVLITSGHFSRHFRQGDECWCTYADKNPESKIPYKCGVCHSVVKNGEIRYLGDCTHHLAGTIIKMVLKDTH